MNLLSTLESYEAFRRAINDRVPPNHVAQLNEEPLRSRALCGEHGRVCPTRQKLCPFCAGIVEWISEPQKGRAA